MEAIGPWRKVLLMLVVWNVLVVLNGLSLVLNSYSGNVLLTLLAAVVLALLFSMHPSSKNPPHN